MDIDFYMEIILFLFQTFSIIPFDSLMFKNPVIDISPSPEGIFILQDDRISEYTPSSGITREIPLSRSLPLLKGFFQDPFFFYLYTQNKIYFVKRGDFIDSLSLGRAEIEKGRVSEGELFLLDSGNNRIITVYPSRRIGFIGQGRLIEPVDMEVGPSGEILVIDRGEGSLTIWDRIGNLKKEVELPSPEVDRIALSTDQSLYFIAQRQGKIWKREGDGYSCAKIGELQIKRVVSFNKFLLLLIPWHKILVFRIFD